MARTDLHIVEVVLVNELKELLGQRKTAFEALGARQVRPVASVQSICPRASVERETDTLALLKPGSLDTSPAILARMAESREPSLRSLLTASTLKLVLARAVVKSFVLWLTSWLLIVRVVTGNE